MGERSRRTAAAAVGLVMAAALMAGLAWALAGGDGPATGDRAGDGATGPATTAPPGDEGADAEAPDDGWPSPLVDPDDIISGGPPPDGIPPIDDPAFLDPGSVDFLAEREPVLSVEHGGEAKAYPLRILMWHEIVNDEIGGEPVTVTYCPLCNTGIAFLRPTIDGELLDFGTSGKLYFSNLVMYDRQTDTLWVQAQGLAVVGPLTGTQLEFLPAQIVSWADWRAAHPDGKVLSQDTGFDRQYGANPYFDYDDPDIDRRPFLFTGEPDPRLPATSHVLGLNLDGDAVAFPYDALADAATGGGTVVETDVGGRTVVVFWAEGTVSALDEEDIPSSRDVGAATAFDPVLDGRRLSFEAGPAGFVDLETGSRWDILGRAVAGPLRGERLAALPAVDHFWFSWAAFFPDTAIVTP